MNTPDEWHSFIVGFFEGATGFIRARFIPIKTERMVDNEYWYYSYGRGIGLVAFVLGLFGLARLALWLF